jgi:hypothetical protein
MRRRARGLGAVVAQPDQRVPVSGAPGGDGSAKRGVGTPLRLGCLLVRMRGVRVVQVRGRLDPALGSGLEDVSVTDPHDRPRRVVLDEHDGRARSERGQEPGVRIG